MNYDKMTHKFLRRGLREDTEVKIISREVRSASLSFAKVLEAYISILETNKEFYSAFSRIDEAKKIGGQERSALLGKEMGLEPYDIKNTQRGWESDKGGIYLTKNKEIEKDIDMELPQRIKKDVEYPDNIAVKKNLMHNFKTAMADLEQSRIIAIKRDLKSKGKKIPQKYSDVSSLSNSYGTPYTIEELAEFTFLYEDEKDWYKNFTPVLKELFGPLYREFIICLGVTSKNTSVISNFERACESFEHYLMNGIFPTDPKNFYADQWKVVNKNLKGGVFNENDWISDLGYKLGSYTRNLIGDENEVTVDLWMVRFLLGKTEGMVSSEKLKDGITNITKQVASELGWEPRQVQAAIWMGAKANWPSEYAVAGSREMVTVTTYLEAISLREEKVKELYELMKIRGF